MNAVALAIIGRLREAGATLTYGDDDKVRFSAPTPIPAALLAEARSHRDAIAAALTTDILLAPDAGPEAIATWAERVAANALDGCETSEPVPDWPTGEADRLDALNRKIANGYLRAALQRPPSWADPAALPSHGCRCSCCKGQRWWCEREAPKGWRCWACYPPSHLPSYAVAEVRT